MRSPRTPIAVLLLAVAAGGVVSCWSGESATHPPPAEFLIASGDSTYWVTSGAEGVRLRGSPIALSRVGTRFYEVYVADDDHSFYDAVFVAQRIYRRDLLTGDSVAVFADSSVGRLARRYAARHPEAEPLGPEDAASDDPRAVATGEIEILDAHGPYLSYEYRADVDVDEEPEVHATRRGVVDLRSGQRATLPVMFGDQGAALAIARGRRAYHDVLDSVRASRDARARRAAAALDAFAFDERSYSLAETDDREPAVAFLVPGTGERGAGLALPLPPVPVSPPAWWAEVRDALPERHSSDSAGAADDRWRRETYDVLADYDSSGESLALALRDTTGRQWHVGRLAAPAHHVYWIDGGRVDSAARRGLARAFDESALYGDEVRTAVRERRGMRSEGRVVRSASWRRPRPAPPPLHSPWHRVGRRDARRG